MAQVDKNKTEVKEHNRRVQNMFSGIAHRYDVMNRVITAGCDVSWRKEVIRRASIPPGGALLDLGAGTGELAFEALRQCDSCAVTAADFTIDMMLVGKSRPQHKQNVGDRLFWCALDANMLPFPDCTFDAVVSGFLLRNLSDLNASLVEQQRVLAPGGRFVALDTTPPPENVLSPLIKFHLRFLIPTLGWMIAGQRDAYRYLPETTEAFLHPQQISVRLKQAGFLGVGYLHLMFGMVAIYWGEKPYS